ncbi:MAG: hypothetical protein ACOY99_06190 [Pseudomonadota bacterium]
MSTRGVVLMVGGLLGGLVLAYGLVFLNAAGGFRTLDPVTPGPCRALPGFLGPEDIALDRATGRAYVTVADRHAVASGSGGPRGAIALLDLKAAVPTPVRLEVADPASFFPHGLDFYQGPDGAKRLFVVNHGADGAHHSIEIFDILEDGALRHAETVRDPSLTSPNDVAATGPRQFYASNDLGATSAIGKMLETYFLMPWGNVVYYDGVAGRVALDGLLYANGVSRMDDRLYVAQSTGRRLSAYDMGENGQLALAFAHDIPMNLDNIGFATDGALLAAGHPKALAFLAHAADPSLPSPSEVVRLAPHAAAAGTIYLDQGEGISAASIAVEYEGRLFIGAVFADHMLMCAMGS